MLLEYAQFADKALLFFSTQPPVAPTPEESVPTPCPHDNTLQRLLTGVGHLRSLHDVVTESKKQISVLSSCKAKNEECLSLVPPPVRFDPQPTKRR